MKMVDLLELKVHHKLWLNYYYHVLIQKQILKILHYFIDIYQVFHQKYHILINQPVLDKLLEK